MSNEGTLDDLYLEWLYRNYVGAVTQRNPNSTYWGLTKHLYKTPFTWVIDIDRNRAEDGKELRNQFIEACDIQDIEINWLQLDCSVLEMLIGLAERAAFDTGDEAGDWLWRFIDHMDLRAYNDRVYNSTTKGEVDAKIKRLLDRTYYENGVGGIFPLRHAQQDQRTVQLWYQMQAYILEGYYLERIP